MTTGNKIIEEARQKLDAWYKEQSREIDALEREVKGTAVEESIPHHLYRILEVSKRKGGWIKTYHFVQACPAKSRPSSAQVQEWFLELEKMGKGITRRKDKVLEFTCCQTELVAQPQNQSPTLKDIFKPFKAIEIAYYAGVSEGTVNNWKNNGSVPRIDCIKLLGLLKILDVSLEEFVLAVQNTKLD